MNEKARHSIKPNQVRYPTDRQFASRYSPPYLAITQLRSATEFRYPQTWTFTMLVNHPVGRTHSRPRPGTHCHLKTTTQVYTPTTAKMGPRIREEGTTNVMPAPTCHSRHP